MNVHGGGLTNQIVSKEEMQRFVGMIAEAIHLYSPKMVTVGSASLKWNSNSFSIATPCTGNLWSDSEIQNAFNRPLAKLDFYQVHYWDNSCFVFDPFNLSYSTSYWQLDKPVIVGEVGGNETDYSPAQMLSNSYANGFSGVLFWSVNAADGQGQFSDYCNQKLQFRNMHPSEIDFSCYPNSVQQINTEEEMVKVFPNPTNGIINIESQGLIERTEIYNQTGQRIYTSIAGESQIDISVFPSGMYLLRTITEGQHHLKTIFRY